MKAKNLLIVILAVVLLQPKQMTGQTFKVKNYKMTVKGTSTLHEWESVVEKLECKASYKIENNALVDIQDAVVQIPVKSIKSTKGKMMDSKAYDAFDSGKYPFISFTLNSEKLSPSSATADLKGSLSMAGTTKPVDIIVSYKVLENGDLQITGSKQIMMSEFNMEPPTAMMGTIKVGDEVIITFNIVLSNTNSNL